MSDKRPERLTLASLVKTFFQDLANADQGLVGTVVQLTIRPRRVVETFLYKDRKQYIRPTRFVLFSLSLLAVGLLLVQWRFGMPMHEYLEPYITQSVAEGLEQGKATILSMQPNVDAVTIAKVDALHVIQQEWMVKIYVYSLKYSSYLALLFIPLNGLLHWFCFSRRGFNYAESTAAIAYISGQSSLFLFFVYPFLLLSSSPALLYSVMSWFSLFQIGYIVYATVSVYANKASDVFRAFGILFAVTLVGVLLIITYFYLYGFFSVRAELGMPVTWRHYFKPLMVIGNGLIIWTLLRWRYYTGKVWTRFLLGGVGLLLLIVGWVI